MNAKPTGPHLPALSLGDIYFILFRHKWKIAIISLAGMLTAMVLPWLWRDVYQSEAKLLIRYVLETRAPQHPGTADSSVTLASETSATVINTELQILTSLDLARTVAAAIGPEKILGKNGRTNVDVAAIKIHNNLQVEVPARSDVIQITFKHPNPAMVQPVLAQLIKSYLERHAEIHRAVGAYDDFLTQETDQLRSRLARTEEALRNAKTNLNIVSVEDSRKLFAEDMIRIQQSIFNAQAELAEHSATVAELSRALHPDQSAVADTTATNLAPVPAETVGEYKRVSTLVDALEKKSLDLRLQGFLPESSRVTDAEQKIALARKDKRRMEENFPGLLSVKVSESRNTVDLSLSQKEVLAETARIAALESRIKILTNQLAYIKERSSVLDASAASITELERARKLEEANYTYFSENLENSRIDEALGPGKVSNISTIQNPSPPFRDDSALKKVVLGVLFGAIISALALAFLIELYFDRSIKRPVEIENRLGVPLMVSIPYRNGKGSGRLLNAPARIGTALVLRSDALGCSLPLSAAKTTVGRLDGNTLVLNDASVSGHHCEIFSRNGDVRVRDLGSANGTFINGERVVETTLKAGQTLRVGDVELRIEAGEVPNGSGLPVKSVGAVAPWDSRHVLHAFYDTLRDRLITYFEVKNLTHKPKLVALTSCGEGAGVSTIAAGLAAALSETGEGNVLLVDMNTQQGAAHHFYKGHLACDLDDALAMEKRHEALVQDNLYVVTESNNDENLPRILPKRFSHLVPKLKASDYDYIIFDMPPMSQISITPRLARFMDMMLLVVESEKTDRDVVQRATTALTEARANVGVILNKRKNYVPQRIQQEI